ncbi:hypothetical protein [Streptomyces sp. NPDC003327]
MARRIRRSAGTLTPLDLLRHPGRLVGQFTGGGSPSRAEADVAAWTGGEAREVAAFAHDGRRFRQGSLVLDPAATSPVVWRPYRALGRSREGLPVRAPLRVEGPSPVAGPGSRGINRAAFRLLSVQAADRSWELAVPATDVPLVRAALLDLNARA